MDEERNEDGEQGKRPFIKKLIGKMGSAAKNSDGFSKETISKMATLGGHIQLNQKMKHYYFGNGNMTKEKLFNMHGPLHPGMPRVEETTLDAVNSDTKATLISELVNQGGYQRDDAERVVNGLIKKGILVEVNDPDLGRVLVFRGG